MGQGWGSSGSIRAPAAAVPQVRHARALACGRRGIDRTVLATRQSGNESFRKEKRAPQSSDVHAHPAPASRCSPRRSNERTQGAIAAWRPRGERARAAGVARATYFVSCLIAAPPAASACQHATPCNLRRRARRCRAVDEPERRRAVLGDAHGRAVDEDRGEIALAPRLHPGARACGARSPARGRSVREGRSSEPKWHTAPLYRSKSWEVPTEKLVRKVAFGKL